METAKEKAQQLYNKFYEASDGIGISKYQSKVELAKKSAIIAVDEILDSLNYLPLGDSLNNKDYWQEVKNELNQF
jgi:hypothetical protein